MGRYEKRDDEEERERGKKRKGHGYRLCLLCFYRFSSYLSPGSSSSSGLRQSKESTFAIRCRETDLPVKSRKVAIKLTLKKKRDRVVNFLSSFLAWPRVLSRFFSLSLSFPSSFRGAHCKLSLYSRACFAPLSYSVVLAPETTLHTPL